MKAYFPQGVWYDFYNQTILTGKGKVSKTLPAPFDHVPVSKHSLFSQLLHVYKYSCIYPDPLERR